MKKERTLIIFLGINVVLFIITVASTYLNKNMPTEGRYSASYVDFASQAVISNDLMAKENLPFSDSSLMLTGYYFDGVRLYISITADQAKETHMSPSFFCAKFGNFIQTASIIYSSETIAKVTGEETQEFIVVFDPIGFENVTKCAIIYKEISSTGLFSINKVITETYEICTSSEEAPLFYAKFGTTSTLINCCITSFIDAHSFQFQTANGVYPAYLIDQTGNNYSILIPFQLNEKSEGFFISNTEDGDVELRVPINFENGNPESPLIKPIYKAYNY